jgi:hypothetical protein
MFHPYVYPLFATSPYLTERLAVIGVSQNLGQAARLQALMKAMQCAWPVFNGNNGVRL